jgi:1-deoxy-D-xylulose-5-phosphate synthase
LMSQCGLDVAGIAKAISLRFPVKTATNPVAVGK